jgi:FMN-binding protein
MVSLLYHNVLFSAISLNSMSLFQFSKVLPIMLLLAVALPGQAKIYYSKNEAMELAFGKDAAVEVLSLFPTDAEITQIEQMARVKLDTSLYSFYVGRKDGQITAYAAIESHTVRTKPETLLVVLTPDGVIRSIETLAFHEPPEYQPPQRWFEQLYQRGLDRLSFSQDIQGISGATLSTRSALNISRKVVAIFQVMVKDKQK